MRKVDDQIRIIDKAICRHIDNFEVGKRGVLTQDILKNLRDFVEAVSVKASGEVEFSYDIFQKTGQPYVISFVKANSLLLFVCFSSFEYMT